MQREIATRIKAIVATKMPFGGGGTVLPVNASEMVVWAQGCGYGRHHLDEMVELLTRLEFNFRASDWKNIVGLNCGLPQIEAMIVALGGGTQNIFLIDLPSSGAHAAHELFSQTGLPLPNYLTIDQIHLLPKLNGPTLIICSHGQNVEWRNPVRQAMLDQQNEKILAEIAARTNPDDRIGFLSLEPGIGRNKVSSLARAWFGNRPIVTNQKFEIINRTPGCERPKRGEFLELGGEVFIIDEGWHGRFLEPQVYSTPFGSVTVGYAPPQITTEKKVIAGVGEHTVAGICDVEKVLDSFHEFECRIDAAEEMELVGIFGEEGAWS